MFPSSDAAPLPLSVHCCDVPVVFYCDVDVVPHYALLYCDAAVAVVNRSAAWLTTAVPFEPAHRNKSDYIYVFMYRRPTLYPLEIAVDFLKSL
jgi:hypothetical protein